MNQENMERGPSNITNNSKQFFNNYSDSKLFECFLFPYFKKNTLMDIGNYLLSDLFEYIADCCRRIETALQSIILRYSIPTYETIFRWNKISGEDKDSLANFLKHEYDLEVDSINQIKIEKAENGNSIKVRTSVGAVYMNLIEDSIVEVKAAINGPFQLREYPLQRMGKDLLVVKPTMEEDKFKNIINSFTREMERLIYQFVCKLGSSATDYETAHYSKILSEDANFMNTVDNLYKNYHISFESGCVKLGYNPKRS